MCVAMWRELNWVVWEDIKAKYKVVVDSDSFVNIDRIYIICTK